MLSIGDVMKNNYDEKMMEIQSIDEIVQNLLIRTLSECKLAFEIAVII